MSSCSPHYAKIRVVAQSLAKKNPPVSACWTPGLNTGRPTNMEQVSGMRGWRSLESQSGEGGVSGREAADHVPGSVGNS